MISLFAGRPRFSGSLVIKCCLVILIAAFAVGLRAQQDDTNRPHLSHQSHPITQGAVSNESSDTTFSAGENLPNAVSGTPIGDGLVLPATGHVWATDVFDGTRQLVQMKFLPTNLDRHVGSNALKTNLAPFIYKPKQTIEIQGAAASVRLHDPNVVIYIRGYGSFNEDASDAADPTATSSTQTELLIVKVKPAKDKRVISTIAFTQVTGNAARASQAIEVHAEALGNTDWQKITPKEPLAPGEYALVPMPRGQNLFPSAVFDFSIDPKAPANANAITSVNTTFAK